MLKSSLPAWVERGAETAVGIVILALALRIVLKWARGDYRSGFHHHPSSTVPAHRHLYRRSRPEHRHHRARTPRQALGIGLLHGLAGTGAVVLLLIAALPTKLEAAAALGVFAPMSVLSMTIRTTAFAWLLDPAHARPAVPEGADSRIRPLGVLFGAWYVGIG